MKARAAAARARKKHAGTQSTKVGIKRVDASPGPRKNIHPKLFGQALSEKKALIARGPRRGTERQTHRSAP